MIICDMCKKEMKKPEICFWFRGESGKKLRKSGFNEEPQFCSVECALQYLQELKSVKILVNEVRK